MLTASRQASCCAVLGWATGLSAGVGEAGMEHNFLLYSLFDVSITLTDSGLAAAPGEHVPPCSQAGCLLGWAGLGSVRALGRAAWSATRGTASST